MLWSRYAYRDRLTRGSDLVPVRRPARRKSAPPEIADPATNSRFARNGSQDGTHSSPAPRGASDAAKQGASALAAAFPAVNQIRGGRTHIANSVVCSFTSASAWNLAPRLSPNALEPHRRPYHETARPTASHRIAKMINQTLTQPTGSSPPPGSQAPWR